MPRKGGLKQTIEEEYLLYDALLRPYFKEPLEVGRMYSSPLPDHSDSTPSFQVYPGENLAGNDTGVDFSKALFWKDWGYGKHLGHRPIHLVMHLNPGMTYHEARKVLKGVRVEGVSVGAQSMLLAEKKKYTHESSFEYTQAELDFWEKRFHVRREILRKYDVMGTRIIHREEKLIYNYAQHSPCFTYLGPNGAFQIYRPKSKNFPKWIRRSSGHSFVLGYNQLSYKGDILLIMSGMKDGLCMHVATGWDFLAASGENDYRSYLPLMPELRERFAYIGVCHDPDKPGREASLLLQENLGIPEFKFPYVNGVWDVADHMEYFGPKILRNAFFQNTHYTWPRLSDRIKT